MKRLLYIFIVALTGLCCKRETVDPAASRFIRFYGTAGDDLGYAISELPNGSLAIAGTVYHEGFGADAGFLLLNADGSLIQPLVTYDRLQNDRIADMCLLKDQGGLVLVGSTESGDSAGHDVRVIRIDLQGRLVWERTFGAEGDDEAAAVAETADGGFAIVGYTSSDDWGGSTPAPQYYLLRLDARGNLVWQKGMGDSREDKARSVVVTSGGDWVFCGVTKTLIADYDASVTRVSDQGDSIWTYQGVSAFHDEGTGIIEQRDGNFAWIGFSFENGHDYNIVLRVLEPNGFEIVSKRWTSSGLDNDRVLCKRFLEIADGQLAFVGYTQSKGAGGNDAYFVVARMGENNQIEVEQAFGGNNDDIGVAMARTLDGGYALTGFTKSFEFSENHDILLMKLDNAGNLVATDGD